MPLLNGQSGIGHAIMFFLPQLYLKADLTPNGRETEHWTLKV